jgi:hypothetical protein
MTADGSTLKLYRDGVLVSSVDYSGNINPATAPCIGIGAMLDNIPDPNDPTKVLCQNPDATSPGLWTGLIDDLAIWTRTLGADEVQAIYQAGLQGKDVTTVGGGVTPTVTFTTSGSNITVTFTGTKLEGTTSLNPGATWTTVATTSPYTEPATTGIKFFRAVQ